MSLIERAVAQLSGAHAQDVSESRKVVHPLKPAAVPEADRVANIGTGLRFDPFTPAPAPAPTSAPVPPIPESFGEAVDLPTAQLEEQGLLTPESRATATGREFRMIKAPVLDKAYGTEAQRVPNGRRVVVTSALPHEGKTFCAINLAISVAVTGSRSVMLIDADVAQPSIAQHLGIQTETGLIDLLTGQERDPLKIVVQTSIPRLTVIPAGRPLPHAGELLASQEMASLLDYLSTKFPEMLIIIDTAPLLAVSETRSLTQRAGQVLLVVAAGSTTRASVNAALATMEGASNISMILNKLPASKPEFGAYYEY